jgi:hypothetical protein
MDIALWEMLSQCRLPAGLRDIFLVPSRNDAGAPLPTVKPKKTPKVPHDVAAIRKKLDQVLNSRDHQGRGPFNAKCGIYVFYDYDGEPIYVGQTNEQLRVRIRRHLTNQRTDAVAMNVLDPFEVAEIEAFPFYDLEKRERESKEEWQARIKQPLARAEYTVFQNVLRASVFKAVLNEKEIRSEKKIKLPPSFRSKIIPDDLFDLRKHPDVRIARRASTIANLARVISERSVSPGLRRTLLVQARRLEKLAANRLKDFPKKDMPKESPGEETGE